MNPEYLERVEDRYVPPVKGVDLEHALNYVRGLPLEWFYRAYTYPEVFYQAGSRPGLEGFLQEANLPPGDGIETIQGLADAVYQKIVHYSLLGANGAADRGLDEEGLLHLGKGWCNEQARVLAVLAQIKGFPSRLVFASMADKRGHVLTEIFFDGKWVLIDQTAAFVFRDATGRPLQVAETLEDNEKTGHTGEAYRECLLRERQKSVDSLYWDEVVPYGVGLNPLRLFHSVGYCNYFIY